MLTLNEKMDNTKKKK